MKSYWMVVRIGSNGETKKDAMPSRHHETWEEALQEAKRLAALFPNHPRGFAVVKTECIVRAEVKVTIDPVYGGKIGPYVFMEGTR